ncbi:VanZ-like [Methylophilaceae bacterium]
MPKPASLLRPALRLSFWAGLVLLMLLGLMPGSSLPQALLFWDKAQHVLAFALLALIGCFAFPRHLTAILLCLILYGAIIEVLQSLLQLGRYGDVYDSLADNLGVLIGYSVYQLSLKRF